MSCPALTKTMLFYRLQIAKISMSTPMSEASTSSTNCLSGSGKVRTVAEVNKSFNLRKASWASGVQSNLDLVEVNGMKRAGDDGFESEGYDQAIIVSKCAKHFCMVSLSGAD